MSDRPFAVAVELDADGAHPAAWRSAAHPPADLLSSRRLRELVSAAEEYGFTAATFDDALVPVDGTADVSRRLDAVQRAAFAAALTDAIGLVPVAHVALPEPFHVATQLASLDWASLGRAGWIVAASATAREAAAFGRPGLDAAAVRQERDDVVEVARRLWDSWEDDAVIKDAATGRYLDADRLHYVDFEGPTFSVKGPLITPRPPQGQLVVIAPAGTAGADVALVTGPDANAVAAAAAAARSQGAPLVWAEIEVALDGDPGRADERIAALDAHTPWSPTGRLRHVGEAAGLVALIEALSAVVDGVRLLPAVVDADLPVLGRDVLPALRERIRLSAPVAGGTLRDALGLERPANRYAVKELV